MNSECCVNKFCSTTNLMSSIKWTILSREVQLWMVSFYSHGSDSHRNQTVVIVDYMEIPFWLVFLDQKP